MRRSIIIALVLSSAVLISVGVISIPGNTSGVFSGTPLVVSMDGPEDIKIENGVVYLCPVGTEEFRIGSMSSSVDAMGWHTISSLKGKFMAKAKFYKFHIFLRDDENNRSGWGWRVWSARES
jgi:hypothetical protein